jgi:tRNA pseudouridine55 synthase
MFSALKYQGRPLYELAREGTEVNLKSRPVTIHKLDIIDWNPPVVTVEVVCSKGTYIRSLANDLGQSLGCGAHMKNLVRLRYGIFDLKDSVPLEIIEESFHSCSYQQFIYPMDSVLMDIPSIIMSLEQTLDVKTGRPITLKDFTSYTVSEIYSQTGKKHNNLFRAYTTEGAFLAVLELTPESGYLHPKKVFI